MARYNGLIIPRSYNDYYSRSDPQAIRDIVALAADGELNAESKNPLQNQAIAKIVPATASPENKLIVQSQISGLTADVETIKNIIPNTASETNELADKNFVNSTVGTNTANYIYKTESGGEKVPFSSVAELEAYAGTVTNNDYAFVTGIDENGNTYYDRYKADVNDGVVTWAKEYRLNNSSFTAEQWAAIQSGITAEKVAQFEGAVSPVDVVQSGNMSAVTSNAVNGALANCQKINGNIINEGIDLDLLQDNGVYIINWGVIKLCTNIPEYTGGDYECFVTVTPLAKIGNYGQYIKQELLQRSDKSPLFLRIIEKNSPYKSHWTQLVVK